MTAYRNRLVRPVADRLRPGTGLADLFRPYVVMRILGVYGLAGPAPRTGSSSSPGSPRP